MTNRSPIAATVLGICFIALGFLKFKKSRIFFVKINLTFCFCGKSHGVRGPERPQRNHTPQSPVPQGPRDPIGKKNRFSSQGPILWGLATKGPAPAGALLKKLRNTCFPTHRKNQCIFYFCFINVFFC